ncbi:MAG: hypothetical protein ABF649_00730 [Bacillus sp. (in: firmicutes)]
MINFLEKKAEKEGVITPKAIVEDTLENIDRIEQIFIAVRTKNGEYLHAVNTTCFQETLGLIEISKHNFIQGYVDEQEG